jgi:hypothetical protein
LINKKATGFDFLHQDEPDLTHGPRKNAKDTGEIRRYGRYVSAGRRA